MRSEMQLEDRLPSDGLTEQEIALAGNVARTIRDHTGHGFWKTKRAVYDLLRNLRKSVGEGIE